MADLNRKTAYHTLLEIEKNQAYSNLELNHQIQLWKPDNPAFVRELVYGVLENKLYLDYLLSKLIPKGLKGIKKKVLTLLRMGLYQIIYMDSVPSYAAVNETIKLSRKLTPGREGFLNGVLRGYEKKQDVLTLPDRKEDLIHYLSIKYSYDPSIVALWLTQFTEEETEGLLEAGNMRPEISIRINLLRISTEELQKRLEEQGFTTRRGNLSGRVLFVKGSGLLETQAYKDGLFSVQDEASIAATEMLDPQPGETVFDICAAPGGKTLSMGELMGNKGKIIAFDVYEHKLALLSGEAERQGLDIVETSLHDGTILRHELIDSADRVLVDGPCSGLGVIRRKPEIKYKPIIEEGAELAAKQLQILETASKYVKSGGTLLYSTCTINQLENHNVADAFLQRHAHFTLIEEKQLLPGIDETDGFYICKMHRE